MSVRKKIEVAVNEMNHPERKEQKKNDIPVKTFFRK